MSIIAGGTQTSDGLPVVATSAYPYSPDVTKFVGFLYSCPPGTSQHQVQMEKTVNLQGGYYWVKGGNIGDRFTLSVTDPDNVFGAGAGAVISEFIKESPIPPWDYQQEISAATVGEVTEGLYLTITYLNMGASTVTVGVTYEWHELSF